MPADAGSDPRGSCGVPEGGNPACAGTCDGAKSCLYPGQEVRCGLCAACDGAGACGSVLADDEACGIIDCSGLDTECRSYHDITTGRCAQPGECLAPNAPASCTQWDDLGCEDDDGDDVGTDGGTDADDGDPDGESDTGATDSGCSCSVPGR